MDTENTTSTWFIATTSVGKYICRAAGSTSTVNHRHMEGGVLTCDEVYELLEPVEAQAGTVPGSIMVSKNALVTPYGATSSLAPVHLSLLGAHVLYFEDMSDVDQKFYESLLDSPRHLMRSWDEQRKARHSKVQLATPQDLRSIGVPPKIR